MRINDHCRFNYALHLSITKILFLLEHFWATHIMPLTSGSSPPRHDRLSEFGHSESTNTQRKPKAHRNSQHLQNQRQSLACCTNIINPMLEVLDLLAPKETYSSCMQKCQCGKKEQETLGKTKFNSILLLTLGQPTQSSNYS